MKREESPVVWHNGPPPHIGWWESSVYGMRGYWRWWDGKVWSQAVRETAPLFHVAQVALHSDHRYPPPLYQDKIEWTDAYPANARVPRIDPRQKVPA